MKPLLASLLVMILKIDPRPPFLWWTPGHNDCVWTLVHLHYAFQFHTFQGNHQRLQWNVCAAHVNNFSSNLVERVDFSDSRVVYKFFLINNRVKVFVCPVPKISQVMIKWCRRASHLGRFTLWNNDRRATQLGRFTLEHYGRLSSYTTE